MSLSCCALYILAPCLLAGLMWCRYKGLEYTLTHYRWVFVCLFLLPLSVLYEIFLYCRTWIIFKLHSAPSKHDKKVKHVQEQVCGCIIAVHFKLLNALGCIIADCQHGFRSRRSCETQLVQFVHDIISNLDGAMNRGHKQTDLIIMDFAKAFDKVPHRRLYYTNSITIGYEGPPTSGLAHGSLGAVNK